MVWQLMDLCPIVSPGFIPPLISRSRKRIRSQFLCSLHQATCCIVLQANSCSCWAHGRILVSQSRVEESYYAELASRLWESNSICCRVKRSKVYVEGTYYVAVLTPVQQLLVILYAIVLHFWVIKIIKRMWYDINAYISDLDIRCSGPISMKVDMPVIHRLRRPHACGFRQIHLDY